MVEMWSENWVRGYLFLFTTPLPVSLFILLYTHPRHDSPPRAGQGPRKERAAVPVPPPALPRVGRVQRLVQPDSHDLRRRRHVHQAAHVRPPAPAPLTASIVWGAFALAVFGYVNQQPLRQPKDATAPLLVLGCVVPCLCRPQLTPRSMALAGVVGSILPKTMLAPQTQSVPA